MTIIRSTALLTVLALAAGSLAQGDAKPEDQLASLGWLAGKWRGPMGASVYEAYYSTPEGGRILSHNEVLKDGKAVFFEFEAWRVKNGTVFMEPYPGGRKAAEFKLASLEKSKVVVENPQNDFPSRIVYHRVAEGRLVITLSAPHHESSKVQKYDLKRVP